MGRKNVIHRHFKCNEFEKYLDIRGRQSVDSSRHCIVRYSCDIYRTQCNFTLTELTVAWGRQEMYVGFWWGNIFECGLLKG
jgi:hypothetical protein